jgi:predicted PurR-regulated permease PerM
MSQTVNNLPPPESSPPDVPLEWPRVLRLFARWALVLLALYAVGWLLWRTGATITPFAIGLALAYLLLPLVKRLDEWMPRWASIVTVYLVGLIAIELLISFVVPPASRQIEQVVANIPTWVDRTTTFINERIAEFQETASEDLQAQVNQIIEQVQSTLQANATTYAQRIGTFLLNSVVGIFGTIAFLLGFLVIPFFLFYVLLDTNKLPGAINRMLHPRIRADFWNVWRIMDEIFGRYVRGQLLLGFIIGSASFIGLNILGMLGFEVRYTLLLAIIAGIGELIPVIGPVLSAIPAIIVAIGGGWSSVLAVIVLYVIIQQLENQILVPRIVGNILRMHPAVLMTLLIVAASVGGLPLVILSAPLAAIARDTFVYLHRRLREPPQPPAMAIDGLLEDRPAPAPRRPRRSLRSRLPRRS